MSGNPEPGSDPFASTTEALDRARDRQSTTRYAESVQVVPSNSMEDDNIEVLHLDSESDKLGSLRKSARRSHRNKPKDSSHLPSASNHTTSSTLSSTQQQLYDKDRSIYDALPPEYRHNPQATEPNLHYLPKLVETAELLSLRDLLQAAEQDVRLHRARVKASLEKDTCLVRTYQLATDPSYQARQARLKQREKGLRDLRTNADAIWQALDETAQTQGLTQAERTDLQLQRWQRALEWFVACQPENVSWQDLLEKLLAGVSEDQDVSVILGQAADMCRDLVQESHQAVLDAKEQTGELEASYVVKLEAHQLFARTCLEQVQQIQESFQTSGKAALQIGHQLEHAEWKRSQCEAASILIRRWWILENLAEQEASTGIPIAVEEEVGGQVRSATCKMDPLFTEPENSLEASKALKALRAVLRTRGSGTATGSAIDTATTRSGDNPIRTRRFDLTSILISRTSEALEQRLLNGFSKVYTAGGTYDFSSKPRPGAIDWRELRGLAQALLLFDSGRSLHKRYVDMVVTYRFPELFIVQSRGFPKRNSDSRSDAFDVDSTRTELSNLFHQVRDVCTAEFELIAHVFGSENARTDLLEGSEEMPLVVARALLQRVVSDPKNGLQARINELLANIDRVGDFDVGAKKLDTFVVVHEKAANLFSLLRDAADHMVPKNKNNIKNRIAVAVGDASTETAVDSLKGFLTSQELALTNTHRQGYINLELRLLHHDCCSSLDQAGCTLVKAPVTEPNTTLAEKGILEEYRAPVLPLHKDSLRQSGYTGILSGPLKQSILRQPLIHAADSLARARLMFGTTKRGGETTARVILGIYTQMCSFYGDCFLYPIMESLREMLPSNPPAQAPQLPFDEEADAPDLGVSRAFWVALERVHSAAKSFDRELWAENRPDSQRVWDILTMCGDEGALAIAKNMRMHLYAELERRGEMAIVRALDTLSTHVQWLLVSGGESMMATGGTRIFNQLTGQSGGPYAIPSGSSLDTPNSPAVKSLTYCLRVQFVHVQAALSASSLANFWTALSMRVYDILVARLLQHYQVSTVGAVILSRDVEALRSVAMLAGTDHSHWDTLRELLTLYMTPPDAIKTMLAGADGDAAKGLFAKAGRDRCLVFLSRRNDYRFKTAAGPKKSSWVTDLLTELNVTDPSDGVINIGSFAAERKK
jgi:hypothetical protein